MDSDPEVHRYVGKMPTQTLAQMSEVIASLRQQYIENGIARWAVLDKATNDFAGWAGFKFMKGPINGHTYFLDFGYRFARKYWGRGYATESGLACIKYGITTLGFKDIYAMTDVDNLASRRVLEKCGLRYIETFSYDAEPNWRIPGEPTTWYRFEPPVI